MSRLQQRILHKLDRRAKNLPVDIIYHNNTIQCLRTANCIGRCIMSYQRLQSPNKICKKCGLYVAEIFQDNGDYCLCCWQEITCPDV